MASGKQPITRHPLFPATVALWFGALFGVGSLVLPPALLTSLIASAGLDAIISVPISATTRILFVLTLAGLGGFLGARLARRIGKPKTVVTPRKRSAVAPAATPEIATPHLYLNLSEEMAADARSNKRSQLAIPDEELSAAEHFDHAPVPGNSQIFDVSQFGLKGFDPAVNKDLSRDAVPALSLDAETTAETAAPFTPRFNIQPPEEIAEPSVEHVLSNEPEPAIAPDIALPGFSISNGGEEGPLSELTLPRFADSDGEDESGAFTAGNNAFVSQTSAPAPFNQPLSAQVSSIQWVIGSKTDDGEGLDSQDTAKPAAIGAFHGDYTLPDTSAAERIAHADLDDLAPVELLERLAISLREKRKRTILAASVLETPTPPADNIAADSPIHFEPSEDSQSTDSSEVIADNRLDLEIEAPANIATSIDEKQYSAHDDEADVEDLPPFANLAPPAPVIPAALRPIGLDPEDDDDILPCIAPPRFFGGDSTDAHRLHSLNSHNSASTPSTDAMLSTDSDDDETALEAGYNSLRNFSRPDFTESQSATSHDLGFVRIDEPETLNVDIEPVVIFPSQLAGISSPRQDIAQSSFGAQTPHDQAPNMQNQPDQDETERALRSALANIQRMSGAA